MSIYTVSVIPQNLRREETIIQIAESLNYLSDITNDIFKKINNRLETNNRNLDSLNERIDKASGKITSLSAAKNAIQVFSSSKYPATDVNNCYETVFRPADVPAKTRFPIKYKEVQFKEEPLEKLQFFHITSTQRDKAKSEGLGDLPRGVECVNDLLLYNSGKNPYSEYVISDTLRTLQVSRKQTVLERNEIGAAPSSITKSVAVRKGRTENYFYSPDLGDVPELDVPIDLPDLPGIADDLRYVDESGPGIAPSVLTTPNVPNLPVFDIGEPQLKIKTAVPVPAVEVRTKTPPPLPQIQPAPTVVKTEIEAIVEEAPPIIKDEVIAPPAPEVKPAIEVTDLHANLMDAIRKAGGLKNAKLRNTEIKEAPAKQSSPGDLMAEFHAKLSMRRKGISGAKKANEWDAASSAMERISTMIIPPPAKAEQTESATTDEEWE